jgi:hypothetical protein
MENAVQNIQLEELEQFEDIFIAITNFEKTLTQPLNTSFLYKINIT